MGVNLILYRVNHERVKDWDSVRRAGDREFCSLDIEKEFINVGHPRDGETHWRPRNIKGAIDWVKVHVPVENQQRLIDVLQQMESDCDLYFYSSW